jgi:YHS domain-containing protein
MTKTSAASAPTDIFTDLVFGMMVDEKKGQHRSKNEGKTVFLCLA